MESLSFYSKILGQEVKYSVILPEDYYKSNKKYPVVYLLHGLGDDETSWVEYGYFSQISDKVTKQCDVLPMIFIMPQGFRNYYVNDFAGTFLYQDMFVKELIPTIDSTFRTIADKSMRATMGYSMGGFGALVIPLKYPDMFAACVPLSVSIRTDEQYIKESSSGWDDQWGRLFGGVGTFGVSRLTDYYKKECPLYMIQNENIEQWKGLKIYIDSGDDEGTLAASNDKLHMVLTEKQIPHEYRVRDGGHEFAYWREAVPNGLRFISDAFQGKSYQGDLGNIEIRPTKLSFETHTSRKYQRKIVSDLPTIRI
ncbi:MAG: esterase family protein [Saprospiraceae bacterium]|nr:esterase family protein [Saprospiraceae bacterium]